MGHGDSVSDLLDEVMTGAVVSAPYSRRSMLGRCEPIAITTVMASIAVLGSMLLCEMTRTAHGGSRPHR